MFESEDNDADEEEEVEDVEENFVELLPEEDDPSQFNIYALFGVKITGFTYFIEFSKDLESHVFFFSVKVCQSDTENDDEDYQESEDSELFTWTNLSLNLFPLFVTLLQLFSSLPEIFATRYLALINTQNALIWSVEDSHCFLTIIDRFREFNCSDSILNTLFLINQEYLSVLRSFDNFTITRFEILSFLAKCDAVYKVCVLYDKFGVAELTNLHRYHSFSVNFITNLLINANFEDNNLTQIFENYLD
jgi:hypothetical protein